MVAVTIAIVLVMLMLVCDRAYKLESCVVNVVVSGLGRAGDRSLSMSFNNVAGTLPMTISDLSMLT